MAILKIKKLIEDLETGSTQVLASVSASTYATSAGYAGTAYKATTAGRAGTAATTSTAA